MKRIVPIITLVCAIFTFTVAVTGIVAISVAVKVNELTLFAVPVALVGFSLSILGGGFSFLFKKSVICKISLWVNLAALILSIISIIVWQVTI